MTRKSRARRGTGTIFSLNPKDYIENDGGKVAKSRQVGPFEGQLRKVVNGKRVIKKFRGETNQIVQRKMDDWRGRDGFRTKAEAHTVIAKLTFGEYVKAWFPSASESWADTTLQTNTSTFNCYFRNEPVLGIIELKAITKIDIRAFLDRLPVGASQNTKHRVLKLLRKAFNDAIEDGIIDGNPCLISNAPRPEESVVEFFEPAEQARLIEATAADPFWNAVVMVGLDAGLRTQEVLALQWSDIDWIAGMIWIRRTCDSIKSRPVIKSLMKKPWCRRRLALYSDTLDALARLRSQGRADSEYVFPDGASDRVRLPARCKRTTDLAEVKAGPFESRQFRREFEAMLKRLGLPVKTPYAMRHGMASRLISERHSIKAVSHRLGHRDVKVTLATYTHCLPSDDEALAQSFGAVMSRVKQSHPAPADGSLNGSKADADAA